MQTRSHHVKQGEEILKQVRFSKESLWRRFLAELLKIKTTNMNKDKLLLTSGGDNPPTAPPPIPPKPKEPENPRTL